jgi:mono/diheme cytochrome c family protein
VKKLVSCLAILLTLAALERGANAQALGDPKAGLALAQQVCSECHATITALDRSPNSKAPTFLELAAAPGMTRTALLVALTTPHAGMPMFTLTDKERDDIIAYILSLHETQR